MRDGYFEAGDLLCDRFRVIERIGQPGQSGYALRAEDPVTKGDVICKVCLPQVADPTSIMVAQYRKLLAVASLDIARVLGLHVHRAGDARIPILLLEYVRGETLEQWAAHSTLRERLRALSRIARALDAIADAGLQHGDLHAGNVLVSGDRFILIDPAGVETGFSQGVSKSQGSMGDHLAWAYLARGVIAGHTELITTLLSDLFEGKLSNLRGADLAAQIETLLRSRTLPGEPDDDSPEVGESLRADVSQRRGLYTRMREARALAITALRDQVAVLGKPWGVTLQSDPGTGATDLEREVRSDGEAKGWFAPRYLNFASADGDEFQFRFQGAQGFYKPWPYAEREILARGEVMVGVGGSQVAAEKLVVTFDSNGTQTCVETLGTRVPLDDRWIRRMLAILTVRIIPGVVLPVQAGGRKADLEDLEDIALTDSGDLDPTGRMVEGLEALRQSVAMFLRAPKGSDPSHPTDGHLLFEIFRAAPVPTYFNLATHAVVGLRERLSAYVDTIYRLDLRDMNPVERSFTVDVILDPHGAPQQAWTFKIKEPKVARTPPAPPSTEP